jgi:predicted NBD/HSP70 family sugar kinase
MVRNPSPLTNNVTRILRTLWCAPGTSRIEIAGLLDVDKSTVSNQVGRLIDVGIVRETVEGEASANGGRKPIALEIVKDFGYAIGIEAQIGEVRAVAVNLAGEILATTAESISITRDDFVDIVLKQRDILQRRLSARACGRFLGIGVGVGALIDSRTSTIQYSVPLKIIEPFSLGNAVLARSDAPFFIDNDANCCAWGELVFKRTEALRDFLFALVEFRRDPVSQREFGGVGVGFGIVLDGKVRYGSHSYAGEFRSVFCKECGGLQFSLTANDLVHLRTDGEALDRFALELAENMAMLVNTFDFGRVFIGGDIESLEYDFCSLLSGKIRDNWMYPIERSIDVNYSSFGPTAVSYGAAAMVLDHFMAGFSFSDEA